MVSHPCIEDSLTFKQYYVFKRSIDEKAVKARQDACDHRWIINRASTKTCERCNKVTDLTKDELDWVARIDAHSKKLQDEANAACEHVRERRGNFITGYYYVCKPCNKILPYRDN